MKMEYRKQIITILGIILLLLIIYMIYLILSPSIKLKGDAITELEVLKKYHESGVVANYGDISLDGIVKVSGKVNNKKIGTYKLECQVNYHGITRKVVRTVLVKDITKPNLTLNGSEDVIICPNSTYKEEGYKAIDNYDGDLTKKVKVTKEDRTIIYTVKDSSNNESVVMRTLNEDTKGPQITLKGYKNMTVYLNQNYTEPGYEVKDNCDDDIKTKVKIIGKVNTKKIGTYKLTYQATDSLGNVSEVTRTVKVVKETPEGEGKTIYLTFDDGPSRSVTPKLLDMLKEENVKATFFVINHSKELDYLIKREDDEGHTVALHSYSHNYKKVYSSVEDYFADLYAIQNKVYKIINKKPTIIRFPGGVSNTISRRYSEGIMTLLDKETNNKGFTYFDWNISSGDASGGRISASKISNNVIKSLKYNRNIVLLHDFENNTGAIEGVREIIKYGKSHGYTFKAITKNTLEYHHKINN